MPRCSALSGTIFSQDDISTHDESSERIREAISGVPPEIVISEPEQASEKDLLRVHTPSHIRLIRELSGYDGQHFIDQNTYVTRGSFTVASYAAGAAIGTVHRALDGEHCFALVRPPGHHAEPDRAMGFCLFNNVAIAASVALNRIERVAIIDWDLHHGNGTQKIFYSSDRVLYCSIHQGNSFPRTGWIDEIGTGRGKGYTINAPLRSGSTGADYRFVFKEVFVRALERFRPDVILISAGQDPLADDPKSGMQLHPKDFGILTALLIDATDHPLALVLEGGYGPSHGKAIHAIFSALKGDRDVPNPGEPHQSTRQTVAVLKKMLM